MDPELETRNSQHGRLQPFFHPSNRKHIKIQVLVEFDVIQRQYGLMHRSFAFFLGNMGLGCGTSIKCNVLVSTDT